MQSTGGLSCPAKINNLSNKTFGRWNVLSYAGRLPAQRISLWNCRCVCGTERVVRSTGLLSGRSASCGCANREQSQKKHRLKLHGKQFGRLIVISESHKNKFGEWLWRCKCDCGAETIVSGHSLVRGATRSCGCYQKYRAHETFFKPELTDEDRRKTRTDMLGPDRWQIVAWIAHRRDKNICLACGERTKNAAAHHIEPWALNRELRYDSANLVTLCKECHSQFHQLYGNDCDLDDLKDFLKP